MVSAVFVRVAAPRTKSFTLKQIFEKSWEYGKDLFACFVDLEKAYDRVPRDKLWKVLQKYGVDGQLLRAIKSFYCRPEVCVRVNGKQSEPFHVGVGLRQGCVLSSLLFIVYMNSIDKYSQADECASIGNCKISRLLFCSLHELDQQMQASWWVRLDWELQNQSSAICWWFGSAFFHRIWPPARIK